MDENNNSEARAAAMAITSPNQDSKWIEERNALIIAGLLVVFVRFQGGMILSSR